MRLIAILMGKSERQNGNEMGKRREGHAYSFRCCAITLETTGRRFVKARA